MSETTGNYIKKIRNPHIALYDDVLFDKNDNQIGVLVSLIGDNLTVIENERGLGLIDKNLNVILECEYKFKYNRCGPDFEFGLLIINKNGCFGAIDKNGKIVIPCNYPGFANFCLYDNNRLLEYGYVCITNGCKFGLISMSNPNSYLLECVYKSISIQDKSTYVYDLEFSDSNERFRYAVGYTDETITIFDLIEKKITTIQCDYPVRVIFVYDIHTIIVENSVNGVTGIELLYHKDGVIVNKYEYSAVGSSKDSFIQVKRNNCWGIFDLSNKIEIIPCDYFPGVMPQYDPVHFCRDFMIIPDEELILISKDGLFGYINKRNQLVVECIFKDARPFSEGIAAVYNGNSWRFINTFGTYIGHEYSEVRDFQNGLAAVKDINKEKWGFIDNNGKQIIPFRFSEALSFSDGLAAVAFKIRWGYIDVKNNTVIPFRYKYAYSFKDGIASVYDGGGNGHINKNGEWIDYESYKDNHIESDYGADTWDALTDGMEGDYPGDGFDYDSLGF